MDSIDYLFEENNESNLKLATGEIIQLNNDIAVVKFLSDETANVPITEFYPNKKWILGNKYIFVRREAHGKVSYSVKDTNLIKLLLDGLSPEVRRGDVRVIKIVREVGIRSKVTVASTVEGLNPIDSCVGPSAGRVRSLNGFLQGERVDFVNYSSNIDNYIKNALGVDVNEIIYKDNKVEVKVDPHLYLAAVGGGGINSLIASKLVELNLSIVRSVQENV